MRRYEYTPFARVVSAVLCVAILGASTVRGQINVTSSSFAGGTVPDAVTFSSGSITCGTTSQACTITALSTTGPFLLVSSTSATGGTDAGFELRTVGNLGATDFPLNITDNNGGSSVFSVSGTGVAVAATVSASSLLTTSGTFTGTATSSLGWAVVAGADTACNTTCTNACVIGFAIDALGGSNPVACTDATADNCLCAGSS